MLENDLGSSVHHSKCYYVPLDNPPIVTALIRRMHGGSQPALVRCDDGELYIIKMAANPQGANVLANEFMARYLQRTFQLTVPECRAGLITRETLRKIPSLYLEHPRGRVEPRVGIHFMTRFLGGLEDRVYDWFPKSRKGTILNHTQFLGMYIFDIWASHQDSRQCLYRMNAQTRGLDAIFIDNSLMFGGGNWEKLGLGPSRVISGTFKPPALGDPKIDHWIQFLKLFLPTLLPDAIRKLPREWYGGDIAKFEDCLFTRLEKLESLVVTEISRAGALDFSSLPLPEAGDLRH